MSRPKQLSGYTEVIETGCGKLYVTISSSDNYREIFCRLGKSGGCPASWLDGIGRFLTFAWNEGVALDLAVRAFSGLQCPFPRLIIGTDGEKVLSCADGLAKVLKGYLHETTCT